jgi:alkanesulfonate monooxygenase SsuD/methylene tetrahydromethanopterin reductase-like flavin-dependent oxidoreductase (luciferase family)
LWSEEEVTFAGKHFHLTKATCTLRPIQKPYPPIWIAANNDSAIARAGRLGCAWLLNPHATLTTLERQMSVYKDALSAAGQRMAVDVPIIKELHVAKTREEAIRVAQPYLEPKYQAYADWGQDKALPGQESFRIPFEDLARDRFILGNVEEVIRQIEEHRRRLGVTHFIFRLWWPGMEAYHAYRVIEMMGAQVIPYFRKESV